jgi:hypothetical protein
LAPSVETISINSSYFLFLTEIKLVFISSSSSRSCRFVENATDANQNGNNLN